MPDQIVYTLRLISHFEQHLSLVNRQSGVATHEIGQPTAVFIGARRRNPACQFEQLDVLRHETLPLLFVDKRRYVGKYIHVGRSIEQVSMQLQNTEPLFSDHDDIARPVGMRFHHIPDAGCTAHVFERVGGKSDQTERPALPQAVLEEPAVTLLKNVHGQSFVGKKDEIERKEREASQRHGLYVVLKVKHCSSSLVAPAMMHLNPDSGAPGVTTRIVATVVLAGLLVFGPGASRSAAQIHTFGSLDDPAEYNALAWWDTEAQITTYGGLSLMGPQWRTAARLTAQIKRSQASLRIDAGARTGIYGTFNEDFDEWRDAIRVIDHARWTPRGSATYIRLGPMDRSRLGVGHLVNFFSTQSAWDTRSAGVEASFGERVFQTQVLVEDITQSRLFAGRMAVRPFALLSSRLSSLWISGSALTDRSATGRAGDPLVAWSADMRMTAFEAGSFSFEPFASLAQIQTMGRGILVGADLVNNNFIDLARLQLRLALHFNGAAFQPGYFGSLYTVRSRRANLIADPESAREGIVLPGDDNEFLAGVPIQFVFRDNSVWTELRIHFFQRFELWYQFLRHHGVQSLSEYHLRLFLRLERLELSVGQDRAGLDGFFSLFGDAGDENALNFDFTYNIRGALWVRTEARYTFVPSGIGPGGREQFVVQRRFEPLLGLRFDF